jgi:hypothetical protein
MTCKLNADTSDGLKIVSDTSGEIDLQIDASTKVHMDSSGNVGIGTTSPSGALQIGGTDSTLISGEGTGDRDFSTNTFSTIDIPSISLMNQVAATYKNISGLGMDFTNGILGIVNNYQYTGGGKIAFYTGDKTSTTGNLEERMRINASGQLLVGTTSLYGSSNAVVHVNVDKIATDGGAVMSECTGTGDVFHYHFRNGNGGVGGIKTTGSSSAFVTSSDYRLKENVDYTFDATSRLKQLKPCRFNFIADADTTLDGFLAHEVSSIVPEAIHGTKDATKVQNVYDDDGVKTGTETVPDYQGIDQSKLVPLLVKTIQELEARITALESE